MGQITAIYKSNSKDGKKPYEINEDKPVQLSFDFGSKATTLERLQGKLRKSVIPPLCYFTAKQWADNPRSILDDIQQRFSGLVVVRSSALTEDDTNNSMAGYFQSVLGVEASSDVAMQAAIDRVIDSYRSKGADDESNQVIVQKQVKNVEISGVAFTRDLETGAPYYVINYDDYSGKTDLITSGASRQPRVFVYSRLYDQTPSDERMQRILSAIREIEVTTQHDALDIEFVLTDETVYTLQVRRLTGEKTLPCSMHHFRQTLEEIKSFFVHNDVPFPNLAGQHVAYGIMPDWNPAEIIGVDPKPLAFSLYRHLITDTVWPLAREEIGYKNIGYQPGICSFAGKPYVDIRMSFNTFLPEGLSPNVSEKLIQHYMHKLRLNQDFHDKVEFKIAYTCYPLNVESMEAELSNAGLQVDEIREVRNALFDLTNRIISEKITSIDREMALADKLKERRDKVRASSMPLPAKVAQLLYDCKTYGTMPFSKLARFAFISSSMLKGLREKRIVSEEQNDEFFQSIRTVATEFLDDLADLKNGTLSREQFLERYGHLRPGTYDICSKTYAEAFEQYIDLENYVTPAKKHGTQGFPKETQSAINEELKRHGFDIDVEAFLRFAEKSIQAREVSKLEFTKNLSLALSYLEEHFIGKITREDLAFIEIDDILECVHASRHAEHHEAMLEKIRQNKKKYAVTRLVKLPPLIFMPKTVEYFKSTDTAPNFITQKTVCAEVAALNSTAPKGDLAGKIVLIENADPGYDWLFSHGISGLITEFGGAASHMTIRAAEFKLPAAIGCGATLFNALKGSRKIELNCGEKTIRLIA